MSMTHLLCRHGSVLLLGLDLPAARKFCADGGGLLLSLLEDLQLSLTLEARWGIQGWQKLRS
jgi:hypothetical protein